MTFAADGRTFYRRFHVDDEVGCVGQFNLSGRQLWRFCGDRFSDADSTVAVRLNVWKGSLYAAFEEHFFRADGSSYNRLKLLKLNQNGGLVWQTRIRRADYYFDVADLEADTQGDVYLTGYAFSPNGEGPGNEEMKVYVYKLGGDGTRAWLRFFDTPDLDEGGTALAVTSGDFVYVGGSTSPLGEAPTATVPKRLSTSSARMVEGFGSVEFGRTTCLTLGVSP